MVEQVSDKRYAPTWAQTKASVVEVWHFPREVMVSQNRTTQNYVNSITYQVLTLSWQKHGPDTLSVKHFNKQ